MSRLLLLPSPQGGVSNRPAAGQTIVATGNGNKVVGAWAPRVLASAAVTVINAPTGTMANNGAITLGTALRRIYANCYLNLPANAIFAGSAAGVYAAQMSSTTVGVVFNNLYTVGAPTIPSALVPFVTTGPGAYTGLTGAQNGLQIVLPGNTLGPNGRLRISVLSSVNNSAGAKIVAVLFGATTILSTSNTTNISSLVGHDVQNCGVTNVQVSAPTSLTGTGSTAGAMVDAAIDTTANVTVGVNFNNAVATDWCCIEAFLMEVISG